MLSIQNTPPTINVSKKSLKKKASWVGGLGRCKLVNLHSVLGKKCGIVGLFSHIHKKIAFVQWLVFDLVAFCLLPFAPAKEDQAPRVPKGLFCAGCYHLMGAFIRCVCGRHAWPRTLWDIIVLMWQTHLFTCCTVHSQILLHFGPVHTVKTSQVAVVSTLLPPWCEGLHMSMSSSWPAKMMRCVVAWVRVLLQPRSNKWRKRVLI